MLRKIGLQNFKCWKELDIDLAPITLFFGSNSSGKTAILQALLMLKQTARGFDAGQHINFGDDRDYVKLGSYQDVVYTHDNDKRRRQAGMEHTSGIYLLCCPRIRRQKNVTLEVGCIRGSVGD